MIDKKGKKARFKNSLQIPEGDLCFYIGRTDAWGDNGRLLKIGKVRVTCDSPISSICE